MRSVLLLLLLALAPRALPGQDDSSAGWRTDLEVLATELPRRHPNLFRRLPRERFDSAVRALDARLPSLRREQIVVGLMRLVAMAGDAHTAINPAFDSRVGFRYYPLRLHLFSDGLFVRRADPRYAELVGARVIRIGRSSVEEALRATSSLIAHDNEMWVQAQAPFWLMMPEVLTGLGLARAAERLPLELEKGGRHWTAVVQPAGRLVPSHHGAGYPVDDARWSDMWSGSADSGPLWLRQTGVPYWVDYDPAVRTLYIGYRAVQSMADGESNTAFFKRVFALADSVPVDRFVLDVRENSGGNSHYNRQVVLGIVRRPAIDRKGTLFAIVGRHTFSAAQSLVNELERYTNVTFVGEPTGSAPNFFGDHERLVLPHSGISVMVSTLWWQTLNPRDRRPFVAPRIAASLSSADYRAGIDPALRAILAARGRPSLAERITPPLRSTDTALAARRLREYRAEPENAYADIEQEVNALGYEFLEGGKLDLAIAVFRLNADAYPRSANAHDSLGEAYERSGRRELAIASYRRALAINPATESSRKALIRLTASR
ncbi:MAG: tetratricopeptide repeat protein [Gemmatimonadales bacterium]